MGDEWAYEVRSPDYFAVCPDGYNDDPVVLTHLALDGHPHPTDHRLRLAACAPVWFTAHGPTVKRTILCPGCALAAREAR